MGLNLNVLVKNKLNIKIVVNLRIPLEDCRASAKFIGIKIFVNEFVAYKGMV